MTYTEVHANFCEQQITVRYSLILWTHDWRRSVPLFRPCLVAHLVTAGHHRVLLDVYSAGLKCTPSHLSVEGEEAETWVFGKTIVVIHHQMLEVVANGNLILALP